MADNTKIEWTDATWNPITGCTVVSPGCTNCYAMRLAGGRLMHHPSRRDLTQPSKAGPVWNGEVRFNEQWLDQPMRWRRPRTIFVCAHGDLFHESVPDEWVRAVFGAMLMSPHHRFQVLTKRAERMRSFMTWLAEFGSASECLGELLMGHLDVVKRWPLTVERAIAVGKLGSPPSNIWCMVSAEDQQRADERIPELLATPAAVRGVSLEPLLGPIVLEAGWLEPEGGLDWIIVGGESGLGARPMHPQWARDLRDQCLFSGVAFHFKQWGEWAPGARWISESRDFVDGAGYDPIRLGKKTAGRLLDGRTWDEMPV